MEKKTMIVVAGGSGTRMGAAIPKQFIELNGKPILMHTIEQMHALDCDMNLVLVLPKDQIPVWEELRNTHSFTLPLLIAVGGATRFESVQSGLAKVSESGLVGVHDGVRPFVSKAVLEACFSAAAYAGAAVPVIAIIQSLRKLENGKSVAVDRNAFRAVQTPQCFKTEVLKNAFAKASRTDYSDDASVVEASGVSIVLVAGEEENIKITTPTDLQMAQLIITRRMG